MIVIYILLDDGDKGTELIEGELTDFLTENCDVQASAITTYRETNSILIKLPLELL